MHVEHCRHGRHWDAYICARPEATHCHLWAWRQVIEETYGHGTHYLAAVSGGTVQGVLPLVSMQSWLFGTFLVSLPFLNYGGVLADSPKARDALTAEAAKLAAEIRARHVEIRQGDPAALGWKEVAPKVAMRVPLPPTVGEYWNGLSSRLRNKVRRAGKNGLRARWGGVSAVASFYSVFSRNMRNLGTPVYPSRWFANVRDRFPASSDILEISDAGRPVAATFVTWYRDTVELPWIASVPEARGKYSTVQLYWTVLEWAIQRGFRRVDLGRCTPGSGVHRFKQQWGCEEKPLHWYYWLAPGQSIPQLRPDNPRYRMAIRAWQRLPLAVANQLGPRIVRSIP